jgi:prevent-host-death family protein
MLKKVSATEAKVNLGALINWARKNKEGVIIERRGQPEAVLLSYEAYQDIQAQENERRKAALAELESLAMRAQARNQDLTPEEVDEIAGEISRETIERMIAEGKIKYQTS